MKGSLPARGDGFPDDCRNCGRRLEGPADVGWECDCGVRVCHDEECFSEHFRTVADGEATRCLECGLVI